MNKERLLKLADYVDDNVSPLKFSMSSFFSRSVTKLDDLHSCGTTACLAGWACNIPEFQKAGLATKVYSQFNPYVVPSYEGSETFTAMEKFFDLTEEQAEYLFGEYSDQGETIDRKNERPEDATRRIRRLVETGVCEWEESDDSYDEDQEE